MRSLLLVMMTFLIFNQLRAQEQVRYIDYDEPVIETAAPSRDGSNIYHFYYSFNWTVDSSFYSNELFPEIIELQFFEINAKKPFKEVRVTTDSKNQVEFKVKKEEIDQFDLIRYSVHWEISNSQGEKISKLTDAITLRVNFTTDPKLKNLLKVSVSDERIYFVDDNERPRIKIRSNYDGTSIENLTLRLQDRPDAPIVAEVKDTITRINSNLFSELVFESTNIPLSMNTTYYLYGEFKNRDLTTTDIGPSSYQLIEKAKPIEIQLLHTGGNDMTVQGHIGCKEILTATGDISELEAVLDLGSYGKRNCIVTNQGNRRWELYISGDPNIPFGDYSIEFKGIGKTGLSVKKTIFTLSKKPIEREVFQLEIKNNIYEASANFSSTPTGEVYLVIDDIDIEMHKSSEDSIYAVAFSLSDKTLQRLSESVKDSPGNSKKVLITTKVDGFQHDSYFATIAKVIDVSELEGKTKKKEIKAYLEELGFEEGIEEVTIKIQEELKKDKDERDWGATVWPQLIKAAPKVLPLVLMLI